MFDTKIELKPGKVFPACSDPIFKNLLKDSSNRKFLAKKLLDSGVDKNIILNTTGLTKHHLESLQ